MKYLIIPGLNNSGPGHWQTVWEKSNPYIFSRVEQLNWTLPQKEDWTLKLNDAISQFDEPLILVAHSLGCLTVLHWAKDYYSPLVAGSMLVAPADTETSQKDYFKSFCPIPMQKLPFQSVVIASTNDPYAEFSKVKSWSEKWGSTFINIGNKGHINASSDLGQWTEGLDILSGISTYPVQSSIFRH